MRLPYPSDVGTMLGFIAWARKLITAITSAWNVEHREDGTHTFAWVDVLYAPELFGASAGSWSVSTADVLCNRYRLIGNTMEVSVDFQNTSTSGSAAAYFTYAIPGGRIAAKRMGGPCVIADNGSQDCGWWLVSPRARVIQFYRHPQIATNWTAAVTNNTTIVAQMTFEVQ